MRTIHLLLFLIIGSVFIYLYSCKNQNDHEQTRTVQPAGNGKIVPSMATWRLSNEVTDLASSYSPFTVLVNLRSLGTSKDIMEDEVHDQIRAIAEYSHEKGIAMVPDLDVRMALPTWLKRYPDELQQLLAIKEIKMNVDQKEVAIHSRPLSDHYFSPYTVLSGSFLKAYTYNLDSEGIIDPASLAEISKKCKVIESTRNTVRIILPENDPDIASSVLVMAVFTYLYPDVFGPHLPGFQAEIVRKYADVPLAGAHKDEWGFPPALFGDCVDNEFWYTKNQAEAYAEKTAGRDLLSDILLMYKGIKGSETERLMTINHFREMVCLRNAMLEDSFYHTIKEVFGPDGIVAVHPTWFPYPEKREFRKNGLDWWMVTRDWAQTDEVTPFPVRTSLAKKWKSPVWYTMFYRYGIPQGTVNAEDYVEELWSSALAGGRVSNLPSGIGVTGILGSNYIRAETRIRLLNYIQPAPLDCPVAVVFGHASAMNWAWPNYEDLGMRLADSLWRIGIPTDVIPSSEIENNSLRFDQNGWIRYGDQRYAAVVLYNPEFEKPSTAEFFSEASKGKTQLFRIGKWTMDFNAKPFNGDAALPPIMNVASNPETVVREIKAVLKKQKIEIQTPATRIIEGFGHTSQAPPTSGSCRLLDGTYIQVAGSKDGSGDTIISSKTIGKNKVDFNAVGVAAIRLNDQGQVQALAAGGLKYIKTGKFRIQLDERIDLALWKNENGEYEGVIQGWMGEIPYRLLTITKNWQRLELPLEYTGIEKVILKKARIEDKLSHAGEKSDKIENITDIEGNTYRVVKIGTQVWMAENLNTGKYNNGDLILEPGTHDALWNDPQGGAFSWYENDSLSYGKDGKLYNWNAVRSGKLCPAGWHVPTSEDWSLLIDHLYVQNKTEVLQKTKDHLSEGTLFNPLASGYRSHFRGFMSHGRYGLWWSSTDTRRRAVWDADERSLYLTNDREISPNHGLSIRCIRDNN